MPGRRRGVADPGKNSGQRAVRLLSGSALLLDAVGLVGVAPMRWRGPSCSREKLPSNQTAWAVALNASTCVAMRSRNQPVVGG